MRRPGWKNKGESTFSTIDYEKGGLLYGCGPWLLARVESSTLKR